MGKLDSITNWALETERADALAELLRGQGIDAKAIDRKGPEAVNHHVPMLYSPGTDAPIRPAGVVKLTGHDVELIELYKLMVGGKGSHTMYWYSYVVKQNTEGLEVLLSAEVRFNRVAENVVDDFFWQGGTLADALNQDARLKELMQRSDVPQLRVAPDTKDGIVSIKRGGYLPRSGGSFVPTFGKNDMPSLAELEIADRIMMHVKEVTAKFRANALAAGETSPVQVRLPKRRTSAWYFGVIFVSILAIWLVMMVVITVLAPQQYQAALPVNVSNVTVEVRPEGNLCNVTFTMGNTGSTSVRCTGHCVLYIDSAWYSEIYFIVDLGPNEVQNNTLCVDYPIGIDSSHATADFHFAQ